MSTDNLEVYVIVDDQSPQVTYNGEWFRNDTDGAWNSTLSGTETAKSSATLQFNGNRVAVYGAVLFTKEQGPPQSVYALDDGTPSLWIPPVNANNTFDTFFTSPLLADGDHTLTIELLSNGTPFYLDYFLFNVSEATMTSMTAAPASIRPTIITTIIQAPTNVADASQGDGSSVSVGPIVGGVVGGVALLIAAFLAVYFCWKPTRSRASYQYHATSTDARDTSDTEPLFLGSGAAPSARKSNMSAVSTITPYPPTPRSARSASLYSVPSAALRSPSISVLSPPPDLHGTMGGLSEHSSFTESSRASSAVAGPSALALASTAPLRMTPRQRKAAEAGIHTPPAAPVRQHNDSGYRFDTAGPSSSQPLPHSDHSEEPPPAYSES